MAILISILAGMALASGAYGVVKGYQQAREDFAHPSFSWSTFFSDPAGAFHGVLDATEGAAIVFLALYVALAAWT